MYRTLISPDPLADHLHHPQWVTVDCRFSLEDHDEGRRLYEEAHIPGAVYAHLNEDLSGEIIPGKTGRHPLPRPEDFVDTLSSWGIDGDVQVVGYDARGGAIAARLWWMLKWLGHEKVAVLDGGWPAWVEGGYPMEDKVPEPEWREFSPQVHPEMAVDADFVDRIRYDDRYLLVDARDGERYRGEVEPHDPVAGHIPGAISAPYVDNLNPEDHFLSRKELGEKYERLLGEKSPEQAVFYCGSGVTSTLHLLAMAHAGLGIPRLYPGSWSEWITAEDRPIA